MIFVYVLLGALILAIPDSAESSEDRPVPIYISETVYDFKADAFTEYLKPGEVMPDAAIGELICYSDRYASTYLFGDYEDIWDKLNDSGQLILNNAMVTYANSVCEQAWEAWNAINAHRKSPPSRDF